MVNQYLLIYCNNFRDEDESVIQVGMDYKKQKQQQQQVKQQINQQQLLIKYQQAQQKQQKQGFKALEEDLDDNDKDDSDNDEAPNVIFEGGDMGLNEDDKKLLFKQGELRLNQSQNLPQKAMIGNKTVKDNKKNDTKKRRRHDSSDDSSANSSSSSDSDESGRKGRRKRRRHDSDQSSDDDQVQIDTSTRKPRVDKDGDLSLSEEEQTKSKLVEKAGLQTAKDLKDFNRLRDQETNKQLMEQIQREGGRNNQTVYRDKSGLKVDMKDKMVSEKDRLRIANEQQLKQWRGGAKQQQEREEMKQKIQEAKNQPFAMHDLNENADQELQQKDRFGDPLKLIRSSNMRSNLTKQMYRVITTASGYKFLLPKCKFPGLGNRFDIEPGHRWDGVDRSNGYERKWIEKEASKKDNQDFFRKWATEDM